MISQQQIDEWVESPVTVKLLELALSERRECELVGIEAFHPFEPQKTQEVLSNMNGAIDTWDVVIAALSGEGIMEIENDSDELEDAVLE